MDTPKLLKAAEVADLLRCSQRTLARMRESGDGPPYIRLNQRGDVRYDREAVDDWLKQRTYTHTTAEVA